jgi:phosphoglycerol transferase
MRVSSSPQQILVSVARWILPLLLTFGILFWALKLWKADLTVPLCYAGDGLCAEAWTKDILDEGWYLHNHYLSFPTGMDMEDYPLADNLSFFLLKVLGLITNSYGAAFNWYYLLTYPLTTLTALVVFRRFRVSYSPGVLGSLLFTFMPYHFARGEPHLFLAAYFLIPLVIMVAIRIYQGWDYGQLQSEEQIRRTLKTQRVEMAASVAICIAMGAAAVYYAFFGCFLLLLAGLWSAVYYRRPRLMGLALLFVIVISLSFLLNISPTFLYNFKHGANPECVIRYPFQAETYGLKIDSLVLPPSGYRLTKYMPLTWALGSTFGTYLGLIGSLGFMILLFYVIIPKRGISPTVIDFLAHMNVASMVLATVGGLGFLLTLFMIPWIRCYYRLGIFISFFCVFAILLVLDRIRKAYFEKTRLQWLFIPGVFVVLFVGIWDQTNKTFVPPYDQVAADFCSDHDFVRQIESRIPQQAVFQLPYAPFAEWNVHQMNCYDHMRGYLHSRTLRWSGGAVQGRACDFWQCQVCSQPVSKMVQALAFARFKGIYLDRFGYPDRGRQLENELKHILHQEPLISMNQRLAFFDMSGYVQNLRGRFDETKWQVQEKVALTPLAVYPAWLQGFYPLEGSPEDNWRWSSGTGKLEIRNTGSDSARIVLRMSFEGNGPRPAQLCVRGPQFCESFQLGLGKPCSLCQTVTLSPGRHVIEFECDGERISSDPGPRILVFRVLNFRLECVECADSYLGEPQSPGY